MNKNFLLILTAWVISCTPPTQYDVIIRNGTIYDGSGNPPFQGDIGILEDKISKVGTVEGRGELEVDAKGKAISPGFINMLSWANVSMIEDGRSQSDVRQGVTLEVMGEGSSMGPLNEAMKKEMMESQEDIKYDVPWSTLGQYLQHLEDKGVSPNVASFVGNGTLRKHVIGYDGREATPEEMEEMKRLTREAMEEGAMGISSSLLYTPSMHADTEELIELASVVSEYNGMYISHIRNEGDYLLEAIDELLEIGQKADLHSEVYHLKASGQQNWHKMDLAIRKIDSAREAGQPVTADMYTYNASSTGLHVQLPNWIRDGGIESMIERLKDPAQKSKAMEEMEFQNPPNTILLVGVKSEPLRKYIGKHLNEVAKELNMSPAETVVHLILEDESRIQVVYFSMSAENILKKAAVPWVSFCSDAGSYTNEGVFIKQSTHPRAYGSFIRVIGKFVRDDQIMTMEEGIRKLTSLPATNLKIKDRGLIKEGYFADIVIFNPEKVNDKATFQEPHQYAEGVEHVFVNGIQVLQDGAHTGATPGRFVKGPGWKKK